MSSFTFKLPDVGEGVAEAEIVEWHVKKGDTVEEDSPLVDVMTDKATVEITSPVSGTVTDLKGEPGDMVATGSPLVEFRLEGAAPSEDEAAEKALGDAAEQAEAPPAEKKPDPEAIDRATKAAAGRSSEPRREEREEKPAAASKPPARPAAAPVREGKPLAAPAVRRRAREAQVDLALVPGSGPAGRITHEDLDAFVESGGRLSGGPSRAKRTGVKEIKVIGLRRKIAEKMTTSNEHIPHFGYVEEVDMTSVEELRRHLNETRGEGRPKLTVLPFLMQAMVRAVQEFPQVNATFDDEKGVIHQHEAVHFGIATQTANGLMVPVVRHAEALDVWDCANEVARMAEAARSGSAKRDELTGSTITITSLGAIGGIATMPVINHPEVGIIGVNKMQERPVVRDGEITVRTMMNISSCFDHRAVDGYDGARFVQRIKSLLEYPATIFM
ncbi:MAG: dihydrolipoamide acetyltransferase family protein [Alphaproteobacteria bacterium]